MTPQQYCQNKAAPKGSALYYSLLFLSADRRDAIAAVYAFCQEVEEIRKECTDLDLAKTKTLWWRNEVNNMFAGRPQHPISKALSSVIKQHDIPQEQLNQILDGVEMDLSQNTFPDFKSLQLYCYQTGAVPAQISANIVGYENRKTLKFAHDLGIARKLSEIIFDIGVEARRDRVYIPIDELTQFNVKFTDVLHLYETPEFIRLITFQAQRASSFYQHALAELPSEDRRLQRPGIIMANIYQTLLREIAEDGYHVLNKQTSLTPLRKLWIAWRT